MLLKLCSLPHHIRPRVTSVEQLTVLRSNRLVTSEWRGTQAVRGRSAKPFIAGSIPARASILRSFPGQKSCKDSSSLSPGNLLCDILFQRTDGLAVDQALGEERAEKVVGSRQHQH
jgi:hypothetical protein